jgi:hypothetical protein
MSAFTTCAAPRAVAPDPSKRVNYMHGLVLGADELRQETAYLAGRAEELAREVLGYGTVSGLTVENVQSPQRGPAIVVGSGLALSRRGRPIRLPLACAVHVNEWLEAQRHAIVPHLRPGAESPPNDVLTVYLVLSYCECVTDDVPGPGQPCRTDEPPSLYTRIADGSRLDLRYQPPDQTEEDAVRQFIAWLRSVDLVSSDLDALTLDEFLDALRAASALSSPPGEGLTSPPGPLQIPASRANEYFDAAFRVWVSEIRRIWRSGMSAPATCADGVSADDGVLLAELQLPLVLRENERWVIDDTARIEIRQERRPYLLHLRLLQEWVVSRETVAAGVQRVAAAGILRGDVDTTSQRQPLINGLRVTNVVDGELTFTFNSYAPPAQQGPFQFVVKAQSHVRPSPGPPAIVSIAGFGPGGITLRVADGQGNALTAVELGSLEISVEVTRYAS